MFAEGCQVPLRHAHTVGTPDTGQGTLLLMPAWQAGGRLGVKTVGIYPENRHQGLPGLHSVYILFEAATGVPLALFDGNVITSRRTPAASALAASYVSRRSSRTYTHKRPVLVLPAPGLSTLTGVSSPCTL
jgi:ornithine cyclodeaminase/alanine dehydrogenase-like protein (mu-crystallin family)